MSDELIKLLPPINVFESATDSLESVQLEVKSERRFSMAGPSAPQSSFNAQHEIIKLNARFDQLETYLDKMLKFLHSTAPTIQVIQNQFNSDNQQNQIGDNNAQGKSV